MLFHSSNAAIAVPWAIVGAISIASVLGTGKCVVVSLFSIDQSMRNIAIMIVFAFCMGTDLDSIVHNPIGQPMATVCINYCDRISIYRLIAFS